MKTCTKCGESKPLDEFHRDKARRDGREPRCKTCRRAQASEYYARADVKARKSEYYSQNRDAILARKAEYWQANPHLRWEYDYRHRARAYGFDPRVVSFTREELIERWGTRCFHCGSEDGTTLDHYPTPISRGGAHSLENCRPSCMNCQQYSWREDFTA